MATNCRPFRGWHCRSENLLYPAEARRMVLEGVERAKAAKVD